MIVYKLRYKLLLLKSDFLKILHPVSSKCLNSVLLSRSMQVDLSSIDQIKFNSISSHFAGNTIRNYCCCDSKSTMMPTSTSTEQNEFENIKKLLQKCLDDVVTDQKIHQGSLVSNTVIHQFCKAYSALTPELRERVLMYISSHYGVDHCRVEKTCEALLNSSKVDSSSVSHLHPEERLRYHLQPVYYHLFLLIGRLTDGVKFLTEMRNDALDFAFNSTNSDSFQLRDYSNQLKSVLSIWFSVGLLKLTRITWEIPADVLEKIAKHEAVHSVRSWTDLKMRLGPNRRCYAFFHSSMPRVPLLLLHVALTKDITAKITDIVDYSERKIPPETGVSDKTTAMFYSITSTQRGLQGIEFGIHMIRAVVRELQHALSTLQQFSSLSPIPRFNVWLQGQLSHAIKQDIEVFLPHEVCKMSAFFGVSSAVSVVEHVVTVLSQNSWVKDAGTVEVLKEPLLRLCAEYLHDVKSRGYAYDPVANFHLRNGATLWRINWMADLSAKGMNQSLGLMVNYRYFLNEIEENSRQYVLGKTLSVSQEVLDLVSLKSTTKSTL